MGSNLKEKPDEVKKLTVKQTHYLDEVLRLHREKGYGERRISRIIPIGHTTVSRWIITFATRNNQNFEEMSKKELEGADLSATAKIKSLEADVKRLEQELKLSKLKSDFYDEMINVAEAKFNIPIRKKAGTKR